MYVVINQDECEEYAYNNRLAAQSKLVDLCDQGITAYMVCEKQYQSINLAELSLNY